MSYLSVEFKLIRDLYELVSNSIISEEENLNEEMRQLLQRAREYLERKG